MKALIEIGIIITGKLDDKTLRSLNLEIRDTLNKNGIIMNGLLVEY